MVSKAPPRRGRLCGVFTLLPTFTDDVPDDGIYIIIPTLLYNYLHIWIGNNAMRNALSVRAESPSYEARLK
jgi:hypothetical protein